MHKYQPRVHIIKRPEDSKGMMSSSSYSSMMSYGGGNHHNQHHQIAAAKLQVTADLDAYEHKTFIFPETSFIAVTAYQNQLVIIINTHSKKKRII